MSFCPAGIGGVALFTDAEIKPKIIRGNMSPRLEALALPNSNRMTPSPETIASARLSGNPLLLSPISSSRSHLSSPRSTRAEERHRAQLRKIGFLPTGTPRVAQTGSIESDRWNMKREQQRMDRSLANIRAGTDSWAPASWWQYQHLITHNPKRDYLKKQADDKDAREVAMAQQRVRESRSHYAADDTAYHEARRRNRYQQEVRKHKLEKIDRENAAICAKILEAASRPSFETRPSEFSMSRLGSRMVTNGR
jgi:hypothetical protein